MPREVRGSGAKWGGMVGRGTEAFERRRRRKRLCHCGSDMLEAVSLQIARKGTETTEKGVS